MPPTGAPVYPTEQRRPAKVPIHPTRMIGHCAFADQSRKVELWEEVPREMTETPSEPSRPFLYHAEVSSGSCNAARPSSIGSTPSILRSIELALTISGVGIRRIGHWRCKQIALAVLVAPSVTPFECPVAGACRTRGSWLSTENLIRWPTSHCLPSTAARRGGARRRCRRPWSRMQWQRPCQPPRHLV
jgi:hypothetical protein